MSRDPYQDELMVLLPRSSGGRSAYAYAVEGGYTGTEKEFAERLASLLSRPVVGSVDGGDIVLTGELAPGTYTFAYVVRKADGTTETVPIGTYTAEESAPKTYTIKWCNYDGTVLETDTVTESETPVYSGSTPTRDEDDLYTYTFAGWDKAITAATADATYTATYTQTEKPTEPTINNLSDPAGWELDCRLSASSGNTTGQGEFVGRAVTNHIPIKKDQMLYVKGLDITKNTLSQNAKIALYNANKSKTGLLYGVTAASNEDGYGANVTTNSDTGVQSIQILYTNKGVQRADDTLAYIRIEGVFVDGYTKDTVIISTDPIR